MNYRHGYHAGNFADLAKHAALLVLLRLLREGQKSLRVVDTHAGAGAYDLSDPDFARSKEAEAGIKHLLSHNVPDNLRPLADYVRAKNAAVGFHTRVGLYPGSPVLTLDHLRADDDYIGCELRPDDYGLLRARVEPRGHAIQADGYAIATEVAKDSDDHDLLYLIDPPFELPGDYAAIVTTLAEVLDLRPDARALVWLPVKDLETLDSFLRHMERDLEGADIVAAEVRLRPLWNPMKMNGCALVAVNAPEGFAQTLEAIAGDVVAVFGEAGGVAKVQRL
ncbi:23S rRNA (adenine(2030)-N(6))-methyltransferase RlmJ [Asticcacaulis solisilvae]|uniref:23S rRNA (adenine(2030)-N(6))-methyltransferase RlmJ n=1 Tax=Asticcacaulis solisilvae TaxID=1217274 RepID=UPI003FD7C56C